MLNVIMSVLTNIKYQYNLRILEDFISTNNYSEFFDHLEKLKSNHSMYLKLLLNLGNSAILHNTNDIFKSKIIWLNSFMQEDTAYISDFLNFYNTNIELTNGEICYYEEKLISTLKNISNIENITFSDFVDRSYIYQYLILHENTDPIIFLKNNLPFFSTKNNFNFSKNTLTNSYIYIIDNPYIVYQKIKNKFKDNKNLAQNIFLNLDNQSSSIQIDNVNVEMNKQGWHTHTLSWIDPNVTNSLNGKIILKKDLVQNTFDILSSIILHFIQSGSKIKMDYNIIKSFIDQSPPVNETIEINMSQKEKKFIEKYIGDILNKFNFNG